MSVPLSSNLESSNSENNANLSKKITTISENYEDKKFNKFMSNINNNITKQMYLFKDEILKEVNEIIEKLIIKIFPNFKIINESLAKNTEKFNLIDDRIDKILERIVKYDPFEDKIKELFAYKIKNEKEMSSNLVRFNDIRNEMRRNFSEYDGILKKYKANDLTEELVGDKRKFKTYPELMKYFYHNISLFNGNNQKSHLELINYKTKLDSTIAGFRGQINSIIESMKSFTKNNIKESEDRIKGIINLYDDRMVEIRSEINKNSIEAIKKENENFFKEKVEEIKEVMNKQMDSEFLSYNCLLKTTQNQLEEKISEYNKKYLKLKQDFENFKLDEDKKFELLKESKESNKKNLNQENSNHKTDSKKNFTQRNFYRLSQDLINNESAFDKLKKNLFFNITNTIKEKDNEIKIQKEKKHFENANASFDNRNFEAKSISLIKKKLENNNIKKIINNNNDDSINKSMKNKDLPKIEEFKKDDVVNHLDSNQRFKIRLKKPDKKTIISSFFMNNREKDLNRVSSTITLRKKPIKEKRDDNSQTNINIPNFIYEKSVPKKDLINQNFSAYDISFKPFKDYDKDKILKIVESKNLSKNIIMENSPTNRHNRKSMKIKHKGLEYDYINSKGEISNIIEMPPPEEAIHKSIFNIKNIYSDKDKSI